MIVKKLHQSEKKLTLSIEYDGREVYHIQCINLCHFYCVKFMLLQFLKGKKIENKILKPLVDKGHSFQK